ncbi:elongation factor P--(R)-beta-lysine ligase [Pantoea sp. Mhis]|uniref:elongation factor P--(R)-beta-lysine ligase n=1 Tax=Pantoea sp. Mhis TaxID=2576759 RepID=UPI0013577B17|nr:elongation factor P--(R)-beta-lysine ligase [Pantoea sp. Mhis]MXP56760.1 elongation factor P--(R)-beta-lysine ligase [Pantoea sp. Mhis]
MNKKDNWKPSISLENLLKRASIINRIRSFLDQRGVVEVDTPMMSQASITDVHLVPFQTNFVDMSGKKYDLWLNTSPEYHMKRLLAAGSGSIYQICHSFRNGEIGRYHNPEFTILEWYRPSYDMYQLMNEVNELLHEILHCENAELISYQEVFLRYLKIDPLSASKIELCKALDNLNENQLLVQQEQDTDTVLQLLFMLGVEPKIGIDKPTFIYHFPCNQAALASINIQDNRVAERFELYYRGVELANGFYELTDSLEQHHRFNKDHKYRAIHGLPQYPIDTNLLDALAYGLPSCSGVALGIDRLIMLTLGLNSLHEVLTFPIDRC